jgi:hypothetical protein
MEKKLIMKSISEHDIVLEDGLTIRINKLKQIISSICTCVKFKFTCHCNFDIRKVQNIVKEIYAGGEIKVTITEDLDI